MGLFNSYTRVSVLGRMGSDIEPRTIQNGTLVADFSVAVSDRIRKGEEWVEDTTWVDITAWAKTVEFLQKFGGKGKIVLVDGRLKQNKWVDKSTNQNRSKLKVVAENVTFVGNNKDGNGSGGGNQGSSEPAHAYAPADMDIPDDDIP